MERELIEIGSTIRVENGPALKTGIATEGLLESLQYRYRIQAYNVLGEPVGPARTDALGKPVVLGEPMHYLDWDGAWVWYISQLQTVRHDERTVADLAKRRGIPPEELPEEECMTERWEQVAVEPSKDAALVAAGRLAEGGD